MHTLRHIASPAALLAGLLLLVSCSSHRGRTAHSDAALDLACSGHLREAQSELRQSMDAQELGPDELLQELLIGFAETVTDCLPTQLAGQAVFCGYRLALRDNPCNGIARIDSVYRVQRSAPWRLSLLKRIRPTACSSPRTGGATSQTRAVASVQLGDHCEAATWRSGVCL